MSSKGPARKAAPSRYFEASTVVVPAAQSREFWRFGVLNRSDADFHEEDLGAPYRGRIRGYFGARSQIRDGRSDPIILRRTAEVRRRDGGDEILLSAALHIGRETWVGEPDRMFRVETGDLLVVDLAKATTLDAGEYREVNFRLSRPLVAAAIGRDPAFLGGRILPKTPLTAMLYANLRSFVDALPTMEESERAAALGACTEFALQTLDFVVRRFDGAADTPSDRLFEAAERLVERNLGLRRLSPEWLALKLGCSRSAIYRLFRLHGHSVMEFISERRLTRAYETLGDPDNRQTIADVASSCGFDDPSSFSRMFRQRFSCTPREARLSPSRP
ncbi:helix-turn-helix domain-containing protein [Roseiarcus sp.]|uniref:helix-turn-helix domain-containing protein n=1 Tax=Roseiarcus sp. TaxID=1969460 RepID=UPI003F9466B8